MLDPLPGMSRHRSHPAFLWAGGAALIVGIGVVDYFTGVELRVYPLYYGPIALLAWYLGRPGAFVGTLLSSVTWFAANRLAGLTFSTDLIAVDNTVMQSASFLIIGLLIASLQEAVARQHGLSRTDPITDMLNARAFDEDAARVLASCRRSGRPVTVACIDLDDFKAVNDRLGHRAGDGLLKAVAGRLGASVRPSDVAARVGGDEFLVLFPEIGPPEASVTIDRLHRTLAGDPASVRSSIGAVTYLKAPDRVTEMVQRADALMYAAKQAGKDRVELAVVE